MMPSSTRGRVVVSVLALFALAQLYQPRRDNPNPTSGAIFDDPSTPPRVVEILERSCGDCHSHRTRWPWYAYVAPMSWLVAHHVEEGRQHLNLSRWGELADYRRFKTLEEICDEVESKDMPLPIYTPLHPETKLTDADVRALCDWTQELRETIQTKLDGALPADSP